MYQPVTSPEELFVEGRVPWNGPVPACGASIGGEKAAASTSKITNARMSFMLFFLGSAVGVVARDGVLRLNSLHHGRCPGYKR
jgi:hypothetical protein